MSYFVLRIKNDREIKSRVLDTILKENPAYSVKEYREERDPQDDQYQIVSLTVYEKGPYCPIRKILHQLMADKDVECYDKSVSD